MRILESDKLFTIINRIRPDLAKHFLTVYVSEKIEKLGKMQTIVNYEFLLHPYQFPIISLTDGLRIHYLFRSNFRLLFQLLEEKK